MHAAAAAVTVLSVLYSPNGGAGAHGRWTLACDPAGGTMPHAAQVCSRLRAIDRNPFLPVPPGLACTDIYGGPETARVVGTFRGRSVWAIFRRTNGCEVARWNRLSFLFQPS